jgi:hypothetical protein
VVSEQAAKQFITILGDSRAFDTYYTNSSYKERYGYDATFPFLFRREALLASSAQFDVIHSPDHFRGGTVENNIVRLALTDPSLVILCDGIWETLVHKEWFIAWVVDRIRKQPTHSAESLDLSYSSRRLADLFIGNELTISPHAYAEKQRRIISYFRRRRRQVIWLSLPMPPRSHFGRLHFAGNYLCIPEWEECLDAINNAMQPLILTYKAIWLDLHQMVAKHGGFEKALIDQWHFSRSFHSAIAQELMHVSQLALSEQYLPSDHISRRFLLSRPLSDESIVLYGSAAAIESWIAQNRNATVEAVLLIDSSAPRVAGPSAVHIDRSATLTSRCLLVVEPTRMTPAEECDLLARLSRDWVVLYPEELGSIVNPSIAERAEFTRLR